MDVDFGLDDRDEPGTEELAADLELLVDDRRHARLVGALDHRAHLRAEDVVRPRALQERAKAGDGLHHLDAVLLVGEPLVDLQERDDLLLVPEELRRALALDLAIHRVLEQDRAEDPVAAERLRRDDARPHLVDLREHLVVAGVLGLFDAVEAEGFGRATAALVERGDEPVAGSDLVELGVERGHLGEGGRGGAGRGARGRDFGRQIVYAPLGAINRAPGVGSAR